MTYKSIATVVDGGEPSLRRARTAAELAARFEARLTGVFPHPPLPLSAWDQAAYWGAPPVIPPAVPPEVIAEHQRRSEAAGENARLAFEASAAASGCRSDWLVLAEETEAGILELARRTDLLVLPADRLPTVGPEGVAAADLALACGGPVLILPEQAPEAAPGRRIVVAWNGSREAARAVRDAWPFLSAAETVHVVVVAPADTEGPDSRLQRYFEDHGCTAQLIVVRDDEDPAVCSVLLRQASGMKADLLVMGLYGHSRVRETLLGGVSRRMLRESPIAVLATH
jgi:nucleotide-binding universal stress UspA family protein